MQRLSPRPLSLQSLSEILDLPEPRRRSRYLPVDSAWKRILVRQCRPLFRTRLDNPRRKFAGQQRLLRCCQPPLIAFSRLRSACLACSRTLSPPMMFFRSSQAVCPEMNTILFPLATTIWENPCGKLGNRLSGLMYSFGINH